MSYNELKCWNLYLSGLLLFVFKLLCNIFFIGILCVMIVVCYLGGYVICDGLNNVVKLIILSFLRYVMVSYYYGYYFGCEWLGL